MFHSDFCSKNGAVPKLLKPLALKEGFTILPIIILILPQVRLADKDGFTPLHYAAHNGQEGALEMLLQGEEGDNMMVEGKGAFTPLHCAVFGGSEQCLALLLAHKAGGVNQADKYLRTPLHLAASQGDS